MDKNPLTKVKRKQNYSFRITLKCRISLKLQIYIFNPYFSLSGRAVFFSKIGKRLSLSYTIYKYCTSRSYFNDASTTGSPLQTGALESQFFPTQRILSFPNKSWLLSQEQITSSPSRNRSLFPSNVPLFGVLGRGQIPVQPKTLSVFDVFTSFFRLRNQPKTLPCLEFSLTFADWSWIVPGAISARDGRGTNPCIAMSAIKTHRSPMSEVFS